MPETLDSNEAAAINAKLDALMSLLAGGTKSPPAARSSYSVDEAAKLLNRKPFTVREWCRLGQCNAFKMAGWKSGPHDRWRLSSEELDRIRDHGLLPADSARNRGKGEVR